MSYRQLGLWSDGPRFQSVVRFVEERGVYGCTRDELAANGIVPLQTACPVVLDLVRARTFLYCGRTRETRLGRPAKVFVAKQFAKPIKKNKEDVVCR